ncbi:hypothetical protein MVEN_02319900 [Mycena venus]|uniref:Uncharacterized protein n=1 Tax=Mycena venus TaxID=2733690 RepID=A0A8H6X4L5_9AGAR|nr:hypothetical protein MVEN_02319900 [Mycena venus]
MSIEAGCTVATTRDVPKRNALSKLILSLIRSIAIIAASLQVAQRYKSHRSTHMRAPTVRPHILQPQALPSSMSSSPQQRHHGRLSIDDLLIPTRRAADCKNPGSLTVRLRDHPLPDHSDSPMNSTSAALLVGTPRDRRRSLGRKWHGDISSSLIPEMLTTGHVDPESPTCRSRMKSTPTARLVGTQQRRHPSLGGPVSMPANAIDHESRSTAVYQGRHPFQILAARKEAEHISVLMQWNRAIPGTTDKVTIIRRSNDRNLPQHYREHRRPICVVDMNHMASHSRDARMAAFSAAIDHVEARLTFPDRLE